jgi:uncharacterized membrane protein
MDTQRIIEVVQVAFELAGVAAIVIGSVVAVVEYVAGARRAAPRSNAYRTLRTGIGKAILLGLELLVAADIVRTVALDPTLANIGILGLIVVVRTFLSWSLEVEITGEWPWRRARSLAAQENAKNLSDL